MVLDGKKTYLAALAAVLMAVGVALQTYSEGGIVEYHLIVESLIALAIIFFRYGIKKDGVK
jgi:hypothetical protein